MRNWLPIELRGAPSARRTPISRRRSSTDTTITLAMPDAADEQRDGPEAEREERERPVGDGPGGEGVGRPGHPDLVGGGRVGRATEHRPRGDDLVRLDAHVHGGRREVVVDERVRDGRPDERGLVELGREDDGVEDPDDRERPAPDPHVDAVGERADAEPSRGRRPEHDRRVALRSPRRATVPPGPSRPPRRAGRGRPRPRRSRSVWLSGTLSVRRTVASTARTAEAAVTVGMRAIIATDSSGSVPSSPRSPCPGATVSRLVPSASSWARRSARDDSDSPSTPTSAVIPIAMPSADRAVRPGRTVSPRALEPEEVGERHAADDGVRRGRPAAARPPSGSCRHPRAVSCSTRPSRIETTRGSRPAIRSSCVTTTIVAPSACSESNSSSTAAPDAWSRLPVGSSASRICGACTSARATATRWHSPPDSSVGVCRTRSPSPTRSRAARARRSRSGRRTPW